MARSAVNYTYDKDTAFVAPGSAAITADAVVNAASLAGGAYATATGLDLATLDKLVNVRDGDQKNLLGAQGYDIVVVVSAAKVSVADEAYTFNVYVGGAGDGASGTLVGSLVFAAGTAAPGQYVISLDAATIENLDADREEMALQVDVTGTAPSITFSAWLNLS